MIIQFLQFIVAPIVVKELEDDGVQINQQRSDILVSLSQSVSQE